MACLLLQIKNVASLVFVRTIDSLSDDVLGNSYVIFDDLAGWRTPRHPRRRPPHPLPLHDGEPFCGDYVYYSMAH